MNNKFNKKYKLYQKKMTKSEVEEINIKNILQKKILENNYDEAELIYQFMVKEGRTSGSLGVLRIFCVDKDKNVYMATRSSESPIWRFSKNGLFKANLIIKKKKGIERFFEIVSKLFK